MQDIIEEFVNSCNYDRDISQYVKLTFLTDRRVEMEYCVPFQRELKTKWDLRYICDKYFGNITIKKLPTGFGSGTFKIICSYSPNEKLKEKLKRFSEKLKRKSEKHIEEANKLYELREKHRKLRYETLNKPLEEKLEMLKIEADKTSDKYEYHSLMLEIQKLNTEIYKNINYGVRNIKQVY